MFEWLVYQEDKAGHKKLKAGFKDELDARNYADMMRNISRMAGYTDRYVVESSSVVKGGR